MRRPNIILIHSDQHRFDCLGINGHPLLQTPNLDRLAREGVNFTNAFTPAPICTPARASLFTGLWSTQHLCLSIPGTEIYRPANPNLPTFSKILGENGYILGYVGKYHDELPGTPKDYGFQDYIPLSDYLKWRKEKGLPLEKEGFVLFAGYLIKKKEFPYMWFGEEDVINKPEETMLAWGADRMIELIERYHSSGKPFFIRWDPVEPHLPNVVPEPYYSLYPPEKIKPWNSFPDPLEKKPFIQSQQRRTWKVEGWGWDKWAPIVSRYLGVITLLDHQIGRIMEKLRELGIEDDTLIVYTTDHGDMCGGHGMMDKHFVMYEDVVHVPLIMRYPPLLPKGKVCEEFVINEIDLATTFLSLAGLLIPDTFIGKDLMKIARGEEKGRDDVLSIYHGAQLGSWTQRMVRDREWKYVWNASGEDELYNLKEDPGELRNLAQEPVYKEELARLRKRLVQWMEEVNDIMLNSWTRAQLEEGTKP
ncbi:sulfatase-like hydrolase/transferase [bacterium]|nr:sulfatase-like hydrolase/transferase [bacterium]